jgi:hypothetical protein
MPVSQSGEGRPCQSASACAPEGRNHNSLDKNLSDNPPAARPNRHADGNLARSVCRPRGEQAAEEVNAGLHDYIRAISDRPKRAAECDEAIQLAETEWKEVWRKRPVSDAEELRSIYSRKREILDLINEHTKLSTSLADAEELLRTGKEERERLEGELS